MKASSYDSAPLPINPLSLLTLSIPTGGSYKTFKSTVDALLASYIPDPTLVFEDDDFDSAGTPYPIEFAQATLSFPGGGGGTLTIEFGIPGKVGNGMTATVVQGTPSAGSASAVETASGIVVTRTAGATLQQVVDAINDDTSYNASLSGNTTATGGAGTITLSGGTHAVGAIAVYGSDYYVAILDGSWKSTASLPFVSYEPYPLLPEQRDTVFANLGLILSEGGNGDADEGNLLTFGFNGSLSGSHVFTLWDPFEAGASIGFSASAGVSKLDVVNNTNTYSIIFPSSMSETYTVTAQPMSGMLPVERVYANQTAALGASSSGNTRLLVNGEHYYDEALEVSRSIPSYQNVNSFSPTSGGTTTIPNFLNSCNLLTFVGTLATLTVNLPGTAGARNGQEVKIRFADNVTSITWGLAEGVGSITGAPASITGGETWVFIAFGVAGLGSVTWQCIGKLSS